MTLSCIIVDDDLFALDQLVEYVNKIPFLRIIKTFSNPLLALHEISKLETPIDFLFTDIEMGELSGLELAKKIGDKVTCLVLVSAHLRYCIDGYDLNARYFLSKPFNFKKFEHIVIELVNRVFHHKKSIKIKLSGKFQPLKVPIEEIIMIEGAGNYIKLHTLDKTFVPYLKLGEIEKKLELYPNFQRVNKSFIININHIINIDGYTILLKKNLIAKVGRSYQKKIKQKEPI